MGHFRQGYLPSGEGGGVGGGRIARWITSLELTRKVQTPRFSAFFLRKADTASDLGSQSVLVGLSKRDFILGCCFLFDIKNVFSL